MNGVISKLSPVKLQTALNLEDKAGWKQHMNDLPGVF